jgi:hypothetical protein
MGDPLLRVPSWHERPSGLLVPTGDPGRPALLAPQGRSQVPPELREPPNVWIIGRLPSAWDQFGVYPDEPNLGLDRSDPNQLVRMAEMLPFERTVLALAQIAAHAMHLDDSAKEQVEFANEVFGDPDLVRSLAAFLKSSGAQARLFPPQHIAAWQRLLMLHGADVALGEEKSGEIQRIFNRAFYALGSITEGGDLGATDNTSSRSRWVVFLVQNGVYNDTEPTLEAMTRPQALFLDLADGFVEHQDFCDVNAWFVEDYGLGISDQHAFGIAVLGASQMMDADLGVHERCKLGSAFLPDIAQRLGHDEAEIKNLAVASRAWYASEFSKADATEARAAWDRTPFDKRPLLELSTGELVLLSPGSFAGWLTDGFYHRALASARKRKQVPRLQRFYGQLIERYVVQTLQTAHPEPRPAGSGRVTGDRPFGKGGGKLTPDVCIDCGLDLVLGEVASGRFTLPTLVDGDAEAAAKDLDRLIFGKLNQLGKRLDELLQPNPDWQPPDVEISDVRRIWPVLVTSNVIQNDLLWDEIDARLPAAFADPRIQPLTLLDLSDIEQLAALVQHGFGIADLLNRKATGPYARLDLRRFVIETPDLPHKVRLDAIEQRWRTASLHAAQRLGFDIDEQDFAERLTDAQ